jgi:pimeloyl-ACP methyl ester carboxylesterase
MSRSPSYPFRSLKARDRYLSRIDMRAKAWPVPAECRTVETSFGSTFMRISGPPEGESLVLLPSAAASSLIWMSNIKQLSTRHRVYAIDNINDFGRSVCTRDVKSVDDLVDWLDGVFDALQLRRDLSLMGLSYGAWITCQYALHRPDRLNKIVMCAPPATVCPLPASWAWYGLLALIPHRYFMRNMTSWMFKDLTQKQDEVSKQLLADLVEDAFIGLRCFKFRMPVTPTVLTDEELRSISVPALFMVGEHEVIYSAQKAIQRLNDVAPSIRTEVISGAGHDLTIVQAEVVNGKVLEFLTASSLPVE